MKNNILSLIFSITATVSFGQIYSVSGVNQSFTITPAGIMGKLPNATLPTNTALGRDALKSITTNGPNVAVGDKALSLMTDGRGSAFGSLALTANTTGYVNSAFGANTLENNNTGNSNTALGAFSLNKNTNLSQNVAIGVKALYTQSSALSGASTENTAVGYYALYANNPTSVTNGESNTGLGAYALQSNTIGYENVAMGYKALKSCQDGIRNLAIGENALFSTTEGIQNVAIGNGALYVNDYIGYNVAIGYNAGYDEISSDKFYISNSNTPTPLLGGIFYSTKVGINRNISIAGVNLFITRTEALQVEGEAFKTMGNGNWQFASDRRLKKNITPLSKHDMLNRLLQMKGVTYEMKDGSQKGIQYGFIAQELREVFPTKIKENTDGYLSADYGSYDAIVIEALKALYQKIETLEKYNIALEEKNNQLNTAKLILAKNLDRIEEGLYKATKK